MVQLNPNDLWNGDIRYMAVFDYVLSRRNIDKITDGILGITWWGRLKRFFRRLWLRLWPEWR